MTRIYLSIVSAFFAALVMACGGCRDQSRVLALVLAVKGETTLAGAAGPGLSPGAEFAPPAVIRTAPDSAIVFSPLPGVILRLEAGGEIAIDSAVLRKRGEEIESRTARLDLRKGCARFWLDEFSRGETDVRIRTPAGEIVCHDPSLAEVRVETGGTARVICVSGTVLAGRMKLSTGEWTAWLPGQEVPPAQLAADRDDLWKTLLEVRDLEPQFIDLEARQRTRTPIRRAPTGDLAPKK